MNTWHQYLTKRCRAPQNVNLSNLELACVKRETCVATDSNVSIGKFCLADSLSSNSSGMCTCKQKVDKIGVSRECHNLHKLSITSFQHKSAEEITRLLHKKRTNYNFSVRVIIRNLRASAATDVSCSSSFASASGVFQFLELKNTCRFPANLPLLFLV